MMESRRSGPIIRGQRVDPAKLARAKEMRRSPTPEEHILWQRLRTGKLDGFHFRRQQVIDGYIVDFYSHRAAVVVEVDGPIHASQRDYDAQRDAALGERGLRVVRISAENVRERIDHVLGIISAECEIKTRRRPDA
jgi:very-short-patch-repair endonuclease